MTGVSGPRGSNPLERRAHYGAKLAPFVALRSRPRMRFRVRGARSDPARRGCRSLSFRGRRAPASPARPAGRRRRGGGASRTSDAACAARAGERCPTTRRVAPDDAPEALAGEAARAARGERRASSRRRRGASLRADVAQVAGRVAQRDLADGDEPLLAALSAGANEAPLHVEVRRGEARRARSRVARTRTSRGASPRAAPRGRCVDVRAPPGGARPPRTRGRAAACARAWGGRRAPWVLGDGALAHEEPEEAAQGRELPRARAGAEAALDVLHHERPRWPRRRSRRVGLLSDVGGQRAEVARVGLEGVARERTLHAKMVEVGVDPAGQVARRRRVGRRRVAMGEDSRRQPAVRTMAASRARGSSWRMRASPTRAASARSRARSATSAPLRSPERCTATTPGGMAARTRARPRRRPSRAYRGRAR